MRLFGPLRFNRASLLSKALMAEVSPMLGEGLRGVGVGWVGFMGEVVDEESEDNEEREEEHGSGASDGRDGGYWRESGDDVKP